MVLASHLEMGFTTRSEFVIGKPADAHVLGFSPPRLEERLHPPVSLLEGYEHAGVEQQSQRVLAFVLFLIPSTTFASWSSLTPCVRAATCPTFGA